MVGPGLPCFEVVGIDAGVDGVDGVWRGLTVPCGERGE